jgi:hypothetical protein
MRRKSLVLYAGVIMMLGGCGGDDGGGGDAGGASDKKSSASTQGAAASGPAPTLDAVLACMKRGGLDAQDQSSSTGAKIGVDYPAGRLIVSFEDSAEDAELAASVAKSQDPGSTAVQDGTVVISSPADPAAGVGQPIAEDCVKAS